MRAVMRQVSIAADRCEGCGTCVLLAPEVFDLDEPPVVLLRADLGSGEGDLPGRVEEAATMCPTSAISVDEIST